MAKVAFLGLGLMGTPIPTILANRRPEAGGRP
jgi:3-hydroxyisobutyrate dehydrogenase-like beta-hydroxyacid dehydrogenase